MIRLFRKETARAPDRFFLAVERNVDHRGFFGRLGRALRRLRLRLIRHRFVSSDRLDHGARRQTQRDKKHRHGQHGKDNERRHLAEHRKKADGKRAGERAAACLCDAGAPQALQNADGRRKRLRTRRGMYHRADQQRQQQRTHHTRSDGTAMVEKQHVGAKQQRRKQEVIPIPHQSAAHLRDPVNQNRAGLKIAHCDAKRQNQTHDAAHFTADRAFFAFCRASGGGLSRCCFLLLRHNDEHSFLRRRRETRQFIIKRTKVCFQPSLKSSRGSAS